MMLPEAAAAGVQLTESKAQWMLCLIMVKFAVFRYLVRSSATFTYHPSK